MTTTQSASRVQIRLLSMTNDELGTFVEYAGAYNYTAADDARTARHIALVQAEIARRAAATAGCGK